MLLKINFFYSLLSVAGQPRVLGTWCCGSEGPRFESRVRQGKLVSYGVDVGPEAFVINELWRFSPLFCYFFNYQF